MKPVVISASVFRTRWTLPALLFVLGVFQGGCSTHHWAPIEESQLPPPPGDKMLHTDRIVVHVTDKAAETQCVAYERYHPVCFYNIKGALERGLVRSLWPSYPEVVVGKPKDARPSDYLLQVEVTLDALPPDDAGPGWSAGARSRFRLLREGNVIAEETLASRSRAQFPYGSSLGEGATEVIDATVLHVATAVSQVPETRPDELKPLPRVASRHMNTANKGSDKNSKRAAEKTATAGSDAQAKSKPTDPKDGERRATPELALAEQTEPAPEPPSSDNE